MTDNRTTELREKLTERGIEYETNDSMGAFETSWNGFTAMQLTPGAKLMMAFTPEQAIAATLGSDASAIRLAERLRGIADEMRSVGASSMSPHELLAFYAREVDKVADSLMFAVTLGSERHAYEQRITGDGSDWCEIMRSAYDDLMANACESCTPEQIRQLTDYIRAELGSGTCENVYPGRPIDRHMMFRCSACGHVKTNGTYPTEWWDAEHTDDECAAYDGEPIRFCPHCGAEVLDEC